MRRAHQLGCLLLAAGLQALLIGLAILLLEDRAEDPGRPIPSATAKHGAA